MCVYVILATEATGDITGSSEASRQPVEGPLYESRVQGGILADGFNGLLSGLFMNAPVSIFAVSLSIQRSNRDACTFGRLSSIADHPPHTAKYWCHRNHKMRQPHCRLHLCGFPRCIRRAGQNFWSVPRHPCACVGWCHNVPVRQRCRERYQNPVNGQDDSSESYE